MLCNTKRIPEITRKVLYMRQVLMEFQNFPQKAVKDVLSKQVKHITRKINSPQKEWQYRSFSKFYVLWSSHAKGSLSHLIHKEGRDLEVELDV